MLDIYDNRLQLELVIKYEINQEIIVERGRRSVEERNVDPSQLSTANVEFIHPKLRDDMKNDEDPENPFVWLNSYSRVPVSKVINLNCTCQIASHPRPNSF